METLTTPKLTIWERTILLTKEKNSNNGFTVCGCAKCQINFTVGEE